MVESLTLIERLKKFMGLQIPCMLRVAIILIGDARWASGVGDRGGMRCTRGGGECRGGGGSLRGMVWSGG